MLILGVPGVLLFSVGIPLGTALFLRRHYKRLRQRNFLVSRCTALALQPPQYWQCEEGRSQEQGGQRGVLR